MTALDRMARAIAERRKDYGYEATGKLPPGLIEDCRTALQAIREPDEGMKSAACTVGPDTAAGGFDWSDAETVFTAMIDHILNEPDPT